MSAPAPIAMPWRAWAKNNSLGVNFTWRAISAGRLKVRRIGKRMLFWTRMAERSSDSCLKDGRRRRQT